MDQNNRIQIDVIGSVDGLKTSASEAEREFDRIKAAAMRLGQGGNLGLQRDLDQVKDAAIGAGEGMRGAALASELLSAAGGAVGGVALSVAGGLAAWAAAQVAATFAMKDTADEVGKMSQRLGESVESISEMRFAFGMAGVEVEEMGSLLKTVDSKAQDAARGVGSAAAAYKAMGISATDSNGKMKDTRVLLEELADKFAGYRDSAAKAALVQDAMGSGWVKLIPLLNGGAAGFREASAEARQLGVVFDEKLTKQSAELNDNLFRIKTAAEGAKIALGSELLPAVVRLSEEFIQGIKAAGGFWGALNMGATLNPFKSTGENLNTVRADLAKMEADQKEYGYLDEERYKRKKAQLEYLKAMQLNEAMKLGEGVYSNEGRGKSPSTEKEEAPVPAGKPPKTPRAATEKVSDYQRLIGSLNEKIAVETLDLQTTEKLTVAEKAFASYQADLASGRLKLSAAEKGVAAAYWETYLVRAKANAQDKEFQTALDQQTAAVLKQRQSMLDKIQTTEREVELFGLTEAQLSAVWQARLEDAIAIARQNGAGEDQIAVLEEELRLRGQLTEALAAKEGKKYEQDDYNKQGKEMDEFAKSAAKNMQSTLADFLFDPFSDGLKGMGDKFGQTIQRMIADAAAAKIGQLLFGDLLTGGKGSGGASGLGSGLIGQAADWVGSFDWGGLISAFGFHEGGDVQPGQQTFNRMLPASAFAGARRYHSGGFAGDEVPAVLKKGERVLTPEQQMQQMGGHTINQTIYADRGTDKAEVRRSAAAGARSALGAINGAQRYG